MIDESPAEEQSESQELDSKTMSDQQLAAYLQEMERQAISFRNSDLADEQATAIDFYEAKPFGDEEDGRSQVVVPVVQEVVDYMAVSVLRTFISGDKVVEFEANEESDEDAAEEATEALNHIFMREQDGYKVLHDWLKCGLIEKICATETMCVEDEKRTRRTVTVTEEQIADFLNDPVPGVSVIQATQNEDGTFLIKLEEVKKRKRYLDIPIPNYEFLFSPRTRHEDESEYLCHRPQKTESELIEMGFDAEKVRSLPGLDEGSVIDSRESATWDDESMRGTTDQIPGLKKHLLRKEYARIDYDGDGIAELLRVYRVGNTILEAEEVDEQPFVVFCPFPRPHRMVGNSLADKVMDIQRNKSVVMRQNFDAFYMTNQPRWWVPDESTTDSTIEDLLTTGPGVLVRGKGLAPTPLTQAFDVGRGLSVLEYLSGEQESRTGITRLNQGLDAEAMNKTATGMALQSSQGQQIEEFVARNFAECLARLFLKKLRLMIEHGDPIAMRVGGEYKKADPSEWTPDLSVNVRVGLGSGRKDQRMQYRLQIAQLQAEAFQGGTGIVDAKKLYNSAAGIVADAGLGDPNNFFIDPETAPPQQEKPDPEAMKAQAEVQLQQQKLQGEQQMSAAKIAMQQQESQAKMDLMRAQAEEEANLARQKAQFEADLAEQQMNREMVMAERRMQMEERMSAHKASLAEKALPKNRPGGDLSK